MQRLMKTALKLDTPTQESTRLFSNIEFDGNKLTHQSGSVLGGTALIAGTTIGAGILALPAVTLSSGVLPSTVLLIAIWLYTLISGLMIAEVTLNTMHRVGRPNLGLLFIVENTLGFLGARIAAAVYLFLNYALLVAYITKGGEILVSAASVVCNVQNVLPEWVGITTFTLLFGSMMYFGREKIVEKLNNVFVAILIASFVGILLLISTHLQTAKLLYHNWTAVTPAVSVMLVAMFYHNIVPLVVAQMEGDARKIRSCIVIGSGIPLVMFLAWNAVILGSITPDIVQNISNGRTIFDPLQILRSGSTGESLGALVSVFSEFATITSFIGVVYSLLDFFKGISNVGNNQLSKSQPLYLIILAPPMILGALNPSIFFTALDYSGTFSVSVLAGIIPALMIWKQREAHSHSNSINHQLAPGGKMIFISMIVIGFVFMWT
jgi:tyrosine-specific transport protein